MRINCIKTKALVKKYSGVYNDAQDGTQRQVDLHLTCTREQFEERFGASWAKVIFAAYVTTINRSPRGDATVGAWTLASPKLSKRVVCEMHRIGIEGVSVVCQPKIIKFVPIEDTDSLIAVIRIQLGRTEKAARQLLENCIGGNVEITIEPSENEMELGEKDSGQLKLVGDEVAQ